MILLSSHLGRRCPPMPHAHMAEWLRSFEVRVECECGAHPRTWLVRDLFQAFIAGRGRVARPA